MTFEELNFHLTLYVALFLLLSLTCSTSLHSVTSRWEDLNFSADMSYVNRN